MQLKMLSVVGLACGVLLALPAIASAAQSFTVTPAKLSFGTVKVGETKAAKQEILVTNTGDVPIDLGWRLASCHETEWGTDCVPTYDFGWVYQPGTTCGGILPVGASCTVQLYASPSQRGLVTATVDVYYWDINGDPVNVYTVDLRARGR